MSTNFKKMIPFLRNGIKPYFLSLKDLFQGKYEVLSQEKNDTEELLDSSISLTQTELTDMQNEITSELNLMNQTVNNQWTLINDEVSSHRTNVNNPHNVKFSQLAIVNPNEPLSTQESDGATWLAYLNPIHYYLTGAWSDCSAPCGGGTQSRSVTCMRDDGTELIDAICQAAGLTKPESTRVCNTQICPLTLSNIAISTPRNNTYNQIIQRHVFTENDLNYTSLKLGAVTVSDTCGRPYAMAVRLGGVYIYKITFSSSPIPAALIQETTAASICSEWSTTGVLSNKVINLPVAQKFIGSVLEFHIFMQGGDDCCKGMNISNITLN